jgi:rRNA maturation RNase YbeY
MQLVYDIKEPTDLDDRRLQTVCQNILQDNHHIHGNITLIMSEDKKLRKLKKTYFHKDILTDVITFNLEEEGEPIEGEIYISLERIRENAKKFKQEIAIEIRRVIIHGCLHLIGYDDKTLKEKKEMTRLEDYYLNQYFPQDSFNL